MKLSIQILIIFIGLFLSAVIVGFYSAHKQPMQTQHTLQVIGWIPNWDQNSAFESYATHVANFQYVSVFWYEVTGNGSVAAYPGTNIDPAIISYTHDHKEKIFALVANLASGKSTEDWDAKRVAQVIDSENARQKHIQDLLTIVEKKKFDGIDIDYESLPQEQRKNFSIFIQELAQALHEKGKVLGVAVYPPDPNTMQEVGPGAQDLPALASAADHLYFMTYLEHTLSSSPGPTGGISWIQKSLQYAINVLHIPENKIFMGIGLMGTAWRQDPNAQIVGDTADLTFQQIYTLVQEHNIPIQWDASSESPYIVFTDMYGKHIVWFENSKSIALKISLAKTLGVRGIAFWRLGGEDQQIWNDLQNK